MNLLSIVFTIGLFVTNTAMMLAIIFSGTGPAKDEGFERYQYSFGFLLAPCTALVYYVVYSISNLNPIKIFTTWTLGYNPYSPRVAAVPALAWALDYVFLTLANPYTPGILQVIFNQLNLPLVFLLSGFMVRDFRKCHWLEYVGVVVVTVGGVLPVFFISVQGDETPSSDIYPVVWYTLYIVGSLAIGVSGVFAEFIVTLKNQRDDDANVIDSMERVPFLTDPQLDYQESTTQPTAPNYAFDIVQFMFVANLYAWPLVASFIWVARLAYGKDAYVSNFVEGLKVLFTQPLWGTLWIWVAIMMQITAKWFRPNLARTQNMAYATAIMSILAPAVVTVILAIPQLVGPYYVAVNWTTWMSFGIVILGMAVYSVASFRNPNAGYVRPHGLLHRLIGA